VLADHRHPANSEWRWSATCAEIESKDIWYSDALSDTLAAQTICMECPVRLPCLEQGLDEDHGVWGGYTTSERVRLRNHVPNSQPARRLTLQRAAYVGPAFFGVADVTHPLRTKEK
jgi:hypothetical protein